MNDTDRKLIKIACKLTEYLNRHNQENIMRYCREIAYWGGRFVSKRGKYGTNEEIRGYINGIKEDINDLKMSLIGTNGVQALDIFDELCAIENLEIISDKGGYAISTITKPIVLEEVKLGRFMIKLSVYKVKSSKYQMDWIDVIALEPNPAGDNDSITHPHVKDGKVCAGDISQSLIKALTEGRINDVFVMIKKILDSYNSGNPYWKLDEWDEDNECYACGGMADDRCEQCGVRVCDDCSYYCDDCEYIYCGDHAAYYDSLNKSVCNECYDEYYTECSECGVLYPKDNIKDGICEECYGKQEKQKAKEKEDAETTAKAE